jgi:hypothetical protein
MKLADVFGDRVLGSVSGLDRVRFRGTMRWLSSVHGLRSFMASTGLLLKDFGGWAEGKTRQLRASCAEQAEELGIGTVYLRKGGIDKASLAQEIALREGRVDGPICMLSAVEPCFSAIVRSNRAERKLELDMGRRQCVWIYQYFDDPEVGFGHVRLQTWLPFTAQICLNGRHWLEKQLVRKGIGHLKDGNCFPWLEDVGVAQALLDEQLRTDWCRLLNRLLFSTCPGLPEVLAPLRPEYYWSADETEYATDLMFRSPGELAEVYPRLIRHAMTVADSPTVLRFFGRRDISVSGKVKGKALKELSSDCRRYAEGLRVKHRLNGNSVKMYDKSGSILRIETTIADTRRFKVLRQPGNAPENAPSWKIMRKGVADLHRRCQVSGKCNQRYDEALASIRLGEPLAKLAEPVCNPVRKDRRRYRAVNPWNRDDQRLLAFLGRGEWVIHGFRNRDVRDLLLPCPDPADPVAARRQSGRATRIIRLLRAHGLVKKVPRQHRYVPTRKGKELTASVITAGNVDVERLMEMAA